MGSSEDKLYSDLEKLFSERSELVEVSDSNIGSLARNETAHQIDREKEEIFIDLDSHRPLINEISEGIRSYASKLFSFSQRKIEVVGASVLNTGSTRPLHGRVKIHDSGEKPLERGLFIKDRDPTRVIGLELYRALGNLENDYHFLFNRQNTIEEEIGGTHDHPIKDPDFVRERIKLDAVSFVIGLDDLVKKANSLWTPSKKLICIDHDTLDHPYKKETIENYKNATVEDLGITREQYDSIYKQEVQLLRDRILGNWGLLHDITEVMSSSENSIVKNLGIYVKDNVYKYKQREFL